MITAVDTNVLADVLLGSSAFGSTSRDALRHAFDEGPLVVCEVVWAETIAGQSSPVTGRRALGGFHIKFSPIEQSSADAAGAAWRMYRQAGGPRLRLLGDFLVGAHALHQADRLLTRDRGFFRDYFKSLTILDPTA